MSDIPKELTPKQLEEVFDFMKEKKVDIQVHYQHQKIRRMEDGGMVIDAPAFNVKWVKVDGNKNGKTTKIESV